MKELPDLEPDGENYEAKMTVLKELVQHHVEEEHEEMFPFAEKKLDPAALRDLGERMESRADALLAGRRSA